MKSCTFNVLKEISSMCLYEERLVMNMKRRFRIESLESKIETPWIWFVKLIYKRNREKVRIEHLGTLR